MNQPNHETIQLSQDTAGQPGHWAMAPQQATGSTTSSVCRSYRIGDKIVRIDAAAIDAPIHRPYSRFGHNVIPTTCAPDGNWQGSTGTVQMGIGDVVENNRAMLDSLKEISGTTTTAHVNTGPLRIKPAWEVDYFRWPRLARRLLDTHFVRFDQIGEQLLNDLPPTRRRIGVCSTFRGEGKTTIAICLARWSALCGYRTLLIDADVERPTMSTICGLECGFGWQTILDDDQMISDTLIRSAESGLTFMPCQTGNPPRIADKLIGRLSTITFQMKYEFDVVVLDMGTIENICAHGNDDMDVVDAMVVTRDPGRTSVGQSMDTRTVLNNLGMGQTYVAQNFARRQVA